jgi:hypothetical protein
MPNHQPPTADTIDYNTKTTNERDTKLGGGRRLRIDSSITRHTKYAAVPTATYSIPCIRLGELIGSWR